MLGNYRHTQGPNTRTLTHSLTQTQTHTHTPGLRDLYHHDDDEDDDEDDDGDGDEVREMWRGEKKQQGSMILKSCVQSFFFFSPRRQ